MRYAQIDEQTTECWLKFKKRMFDMFDVWIDKRNMKINLKRREYNSLPFERKIGYCLAVYQIVKAQVVSHSVLGKSGAQITKRPVGLWLHRYKR